MVISIPQPGRRIRLLVMGYGLIVLLWLSLEDNQTEPVVALGVVMALLGVALLCLNTMGGKTIQADYVLPSLVGAGIITGLGASVASAGLMFFKTALHAHLFPDYPPLMMLAVLERAPVWAVAGGLFGLGIGLAWSAFISARR